MQPPLPLNTCHSERSEESLATGKRSFVASVPKDDEKRGFTLIEMSIVLVIIGLIVGGILVGRDLISAAEVRAQIAQIAKYNSAVNTFKNKYGGIPGDLSLSLVAQFGFTAGVGCSGIQGARDGNGLIDGELAGYTLSESEGETLLFWQDLSAASLIEGNFPNNGAAMVMCHQGNLPALSLTPGALYVGDYFPVGKIGYGTFLYVYETNGNNWYGLSSVTGTTGGGANNILLSGANISVIQAYNIDKKVDDGLPTTGSVLVTYLNNSYSLVKYANPQATDTPTSCYNTTNYTYSLSASANGGSGLNCTLSFRFQ